MIRHSMRWPALLLVAGLIAALTLSLGNPALPQTTPTMAPPSDAPTINDATLSSSIPVASAVLGDPSVLTDMQGRFRFDGLTHASHILRLDTHTLPAGFVPNAPQPSLTLSPGVTRSLAIAPGLTLRATYHDDGTLLDGAVFHDQNGDGLQAADELGVAGARVIDPGVFQYYVPFSDNDLQQSFADLTNAACLNRASSPAIASTISLTSSADGTTVYYDQWEDGYDIDPTVPGPTSQTFTLNAGKVQTWQNNIPTPRAPANLLYDGRDRITVVGEPVSAVRAAWLTPNPGTLLAGAWEMPKVSDWGRDYIIPIGEDIGQRGTQTFGDYDYVSASVMAAYDGTVVQLDPNADGIFNPPQTLNAGQTLYIRGSANQVGIAIRSGAEVKSTLPVQVQVRAGNCRAAYSGRSYTLVPVERWSNDYWSPVPGFLNGQNNCTVRYQPPPQPVQPNASADVDIYIFNPNATALAVTYEDASGTGVINIPPRTTRSYLNQHPNPAARRSNTQRVHLSANGQFWAVAAVDSTSLGNNGADFDWSYALIPSRDLSSRVVLSWSPGTGPPPPAPPPLQVNGSTVYVQAVRDGTVVTVDLNGDGVLDQFDTDGDGVVEPLSSYNYNEATSNQGITINRGQMLRISNPLTPHDMAGAIISTLDVRHPVAAVYGEDACIANFAAPFLDLGYTVLPLPTPTISKNSRLLIDADRSGDISPGDTLEYKIQVYNSGTGPILNPLLIDTLPFTYTDFIVGSLTSAPAAIPPGITYDTGNGLFNYVPTGAPGTADPAVHAIKAPYALISPGDGVVVTLHIILARQIPSNVLAVINKADLTSSNTPPVTAQVRTPINQVDLLIHKTDGRTVVNQGDQLTYTITYTNAGPGIARSVVMTDTLPPGALNFSSPTVPGVITPTIDLAQGQIYFKLGTLLANQVGQTTVTMTVPPDARGQLVNTVDIDTKSFETNKNNNRSVDIDQLAPADLLIHKTDGTIAVSRTDTLIYTITYTNAGPGIAFNAVMTDTLPPTATNVRTPTVPGVITPTIDLAQGKIFFKLGTLRRNQVGKTTVTLTLGPNTPTGRNVVNTVEISSDTPDPNKTNNKSTDIDLVPGPNSVVLSELRVVRQTGGTLVLWRTVAEMDNYGFRVYRSATPSRSDAVLVTPNIIPGQGRGRADGASYSFFDANPPEGPAYYWLEDIDLNGTSEFHGPAQPTLEGLQVHIFLPLVATGR
jgi:uncharacterized repeat protein (TIGR01451 family)